MARFSGGILNERDAPGNPSFAFGYRDVVFQTVCTGGRVVLLSAAIIEAMSLRQFTVTPVFRTES